MPSGQGNPYFNPLGGFQPRIIGDPDPFQNPHLGGPGGNLVGPNSAIFHPRGGLDPSLGGMPDWRGGHGGPHDIDPNIGGNPFLGQGRGRGGFHDPFGGRGGFGGGFGGSGFGGPGGYM